MAQPIPQGAIPTGITATPSWTTLSHEEAIKHFESKTVVFADEFYNEMGQVAKLKAFTASRLTQIHQIIAAKKLVAEALQQGLTLEDFKKNIRRSKGAGIALAGQSDWYVETVFRTNMQGAYGRGRFNQMREQSDFFDVWQYDAINDSRVRPTHLHFDGRYFSAEDDLWERYYPPWGFNCRCRAIPLHSGTLERQGKGKLPKIDVLHELEGNYPGGFGKLHPGAIDKNGVFQPTKMFSSPGADYNPDLAIAQAGTFKEALKAAIDDYALSLNVVPALAATVPPKAIKKLPSDWEEQLFDHDWKANPRAPVPIRGDGKLLEGQQMYVRLRSDGNGNFFYEIRGRLTPNAHLNLVKKAQKEHWLPRKFTHGSGTYDKLSGATRFPETVQVKGRSLQTGIALDGTAQARFSIAQQTWVDQKQKWRGGRFHGGEGAFAGEFRISIPIRRDRVLDAARIRKVFETDELSTFLTKPGPDDIRRHKLMIAMRRKLTGGFGTTKGRDHLRALEDVMEKPLSDVEELSRTILSPTERRAIDKWEWVVDDALGHGSWIQTGLKVSDDAFLYHGVGAKATRDDILSIVESNSTLSAREMVHRGIKPWTNLEDVSSGGADGVFTRLLNKNAHGGNFTNSYHAGGGDFHFFFKPRALRRTDVYAIKHDQFGWLEAQRVNVNLKAKNGGKALGNGNEFIFKNGLSLDDLEFIMVRNQSDRAWLITQLKKKGITRLAGKTLEQAIRVGSQIPGPEFNPLTSQSF